MAGTSYPQHAYLYIIYTPNLGSEIAVSVREREQGRFRGSIEGAGGSTEGARESTEGALREHGEARWSMEGEGSSGSPYLGGAAKGSLNWLFRTRVL